jgi:ligand-binding SRPBCC domain-containing protein
MPLIQLETFINAPIERVFDLSRSIELHALSMKSTNEKAVAGRTSGLIELNETVTWRAKHLGIHQHLTVRITKLERPYFFEDVMQEGAFALMKHGHHFMPAGDGTIMTDKFEFKSPLGFIGSAFDTLFLKRYMTKFILQRNQELKTVAEAGEWQKLLSL